MRRGPTPKHLHRTRATERRLRGIHAPHENQAEERAWLVVRTSFANRMATTPRHRRGRLALAPVLVAIVGVLAFTPAGAAVHRWIDRTLGVRDARPALFPLPAPGQILVAGSPGVWTVTADGAKRRLGGWSDAAWSPRGRYIAVAARGELIAVNRAGLVQWRLARPDVHSPRWFSPDGYRVAYLSGSSLRVLAGDGTGDRRVATGVAAAPAAWRPAHAYQLAYAQIDRTVVIRDADSGRLAWSREVPGIPTQLSWSYNGARLLVLTTQAAFVFDGGGRRLARIPALGRRPDLEGAFSPDGRRLALLSDRQLTLSDATSASAVRRRVFTGAGLRGLAWSPNGRWLLFGWPAADQWVFLSPTGRPRIVAVSRIAEQFGRPRSRPGFPSLEGWCCGVGAG